VLNAKLFDSFANVTRLVRVESPRASFTDCTEPAMSSAYVSKNHECRGAFSPALEDVRASSFLTNGVQAQVLDQIIYTVEFLIRANPHLEPFRSWAVEFGFSHKMTGSAGILPALHSASGDRSERAKIPALLR